MKFQASVSWLMAIDYGGSCEQGEVGTKQFERVKE